jgi:CubicO group peptidase (beta-lactamase class C family)
MIASRFKIALLALAVSAAPVRAATEWHAASPQEQALDAAAFAGTDDLVRDHFGDVQSVVVLMNGRVAYAYYRDGDPEKLRDLQSVNKSALSALVGAALGQGRIASLDEPVVALVPEWAGLNPDPRAAAITLRHLLTMTAGFTVSDAGGTAPPGPPTQAWSRRLRDDPGRVFAYDNALIPMLAAVLEKRTGMSLPDYARQQLVEPLGMREPTYRNTVQMRTVDAAKLGQLFLQQGSWAGRQVVPASFVAAATSRQNAGGPPVGLSYGYFWWMTPSGATFLASGYGGQFVWVHPALELVVATTSAVNPDSQRRGQALKLILEPLFAAALKRNGR